MINYDDIIRNLIKSPDPISMWDWCVSYLLFGKSKSFDPRRAGFMRSTYDIIGKRMLGQSLTSEIYLCLGAQIAKTTVLAASMAYGIILGRQIGYYLARDQDIKSMRRTRFRPMVMHTKPITGLLPLSMKERTIALSPNGYLLGDASVLFQIASVSDAYKAVSYDTVLLDELDSYPKDVDGQGDPVELSLVRMRTMAARSLLIGVSTPSSYTGLIWSRLCSGTNERPFITCNCGSSHYLDWRLIKLENGEDIISAQPHDIRARSLARWVCPYCGQMHDTNSVKKMLLNFNTNQLWVPGIWRIDDDHIDGYWTVNKDYVDIDDGKIKGIHVSDGAVISRWASSIYSVDVDLNKFASSLCKAKIIGKSKFKTWLNVEAAEPFVDVSIPADITTIKERINIDNKYTHRTCPIDPKLLVLVFDQQGQGDVTRFWFPYVVLAFGEDQDVYIVAAGKAMSPQERDQLELCSWPCKSKNMRPHLTVMDCGNPNARFHIYSWAAADSEYRIVIRGDSTLDDSQLWLQYNPKLTKSSRPSNVKEYKVATHSWRSILNDYITGVKPGFRMPVDIPEFYLKSLSAEETKQETRRKSGGLYREVTIWVPRKTASDKEDDIVRQRSDTHWADCTKYGLAIADIYSAINITSNEVEEEEPVSVNTVDQTNIRWGDNVYAAKWGNNVW